jgi:hypothetical protein
LLVRAAFHDIQITDIRARDHASRTLPSYPSSPVSTTQP